MVWLCSVKVKYRYRRVLLGAVMYWYRKVQLGVVKKNYECCIGKVVNSVV